MNTDNYNSCRGKWCNLKQNFSSVSQGLYIANMELNLGVNTTKKVNIHFTFQ